MISLLAVEWSRSSGSWLLGREADARLLPGVSWGWPAPMSLGLHVVISASLGGPEAIAMRLVILDTVGGLSC